jgi:hypothetical protein
VSDALHQQVSERAGRRSEYCRFPDSLPSHEPFHLEQSTCWSAKRSSGVSTDDMHTHECSGHSAHWSTEAP